MLFNKNLLTVTNLEEVLEGLLFVSFGGLYQYFTLIYNSVHSWVPFFEHVRDSTFNLIYCRHPVHLTEMRVQKPNPGY